jgi:3-methyl-2-oxobutanoate hydroxymethyltransferase
MLTAYDFTMARLFDKAGIDVLLVGDSLGMVVLGHETTLPVREEDMLRHTAAVCRGVSRALVVADMPFLSYQVSIPDAMRSAGRLLQEAGAAAVKLEGGQAFAPTIERLTSAGIPVMGHLGLLPQSVHQQGGFRRQAVDESGRKKLLADARAIQESGAFAVVLECIPHDLAAEVTAELKIPTIGIGAGPSCDGQVLVSYDVLGLTEDPPPFAKAYARLDQMIIQAAQHFKEDVKTATLYPEPVAHA